MNQLLCLCSSLLLSLCTACGQDYSLSSRVTKECTHQTPITYLGVTLHYPLMVKQASQQYGLTYISNGTFCKTLPLLPPVSKNIPYNFKLIYSGDNIAGDQIPAEEYEDRIVKGYQFIFRPSTPVDSLKSALLQQFRGRAFVKKKRTYPKEFKWMETTHEITYDEFKINDCVTLSIYSKIDDPDMPIWVFFYIDMTEQERSRLFF